MARDVVLITGSSGLIGAALVTRLVKEHGVVFGYKLQRKAMSPE